MEKHELALRDGGHLDYLTAGAGPAVLMIHGSAANGQAWNRVAASIGEGFRLILPDFPAERGAATGSDGNTRDRHANAQALCQLVAKEGTPDVLVAHSVGGHTALDAIVNMQAPARSVLLLEPATLDVLRLAGNTGMHAWARRHFLEGVVSAGRSGDEAAARDMLDGWCGEGAFERLPEAARAFLISRIGETADDIEASFQPDLAPEALAAMSTPVEVLVGTEGTGLAAAIGEALVSLLPHCRLNTISGADHNIIVTHPGDISSAVRCLAKATGAQSPA